MTSQPRFEDIVSSINPKAPASGDPPPPPYPDSDNLQWLSPAINSSNSDVEFESVPSLNAQGKQPAPLDQVPETRDELIIDALVNGTYDCTFCHDPIDPNSSMWSCKHCYHIFHYPCARKWATQKNINTQEHFWQWPCPMCKQIQKPQLSYTGPKKMLATCWCGRHLHQSQRVVGNSCARRCDTYNTCPSNKQKCEKFCAKLCHPGPCERLVCYEGCDVKWFTDKQKFDPTVKRIYPSKYWG